MAEPTNGSTEPTLADAPAEATAPAAVSGLIEPIRAAGALLGFGVGVLATLRYGGVWPDAIIHGVIGALIVTPIAWVLALVLVGEATRVEARNEAARYEQRIADTRAQLERELGPLARNPNPTVESGPDAQALPAAGTPTEPARPQLEP